MVANQNKYTCVSGLVLVRCSILKCVVLNKSLSYVCSLSKLTEFLRLRLESFFPEKMRSESQNFPRCVVFCYALENFVIHFAFSLEKRILGAVILI